MQNKSALDAFMGEIAAANLAIDLISDRIDNHMDADPDNITWEHVGTAVKVRADLIEICKFLNLIKR